MCGEEMNTNENPKMKFSGIWILFLQYFDIGQEIEFDKMQKTLVCLGYSPKKDRPTTNYTFTDHFVNEHMPIVTCCTSQSTKFPKVQNRITINQFKTNLKKEFNLEIDYKIDIPEDEYNKEFVFENLGSSENIEIKEEHELRVSKSGVISVRTYIIPYISGKIASFNVKEIAFLINYFISMYMKAKVDKEYRPKLEKIYKEILNIPEKEKYKKKLKNLICKDTYVCVLIKDSKNPSLDVNKLLNFDNLNKIKEEKRKIDEKRKEIIALSVRSPIWPLPYHKEYLMNALKSNLSFRKDELIFIEDLNALFYVPSVDTQKKNPGEEFDFSLQYGGYIDDMIKLLEIQRMERIAFQRYEDELDKMLKNFKQQIIKEKVNKEKKSRIYKFFKRPFFWLADTIFDIRLLERIQKLKRQMDEISSIRMKFMEVRDAVDMFEIDRNFKIKHFRMVADRAITKFGLRQYLSSIGIKIENLGEINESIRDNLTTQIDFQIQYGIYLLQFIFILGVAAQIASIFWIDYPFLEKAMRLVFFFLAILFISLIIRLLYFKNLKKTSESYSYTKTEYS